jgi:hypothetical protein
VDADAEEVGEEALAKLEAWVEVGAGATTRSTRRRSTVGSWGDQLCGMETAVARCTLGRSPTEAPP